MASQPLGSVPGWFPDADEAARPKPCNGVLAVAPSDQTSKPQQYEVPKHEEEYDFMKEFTTTGNLWMT